MSLKKEFVIVGISILIVAITLVFQIFESLSGESKEEMVDVVVLVNDKNEGEEIISSDLQLMKFSKEDVPSNFYSDFNFYVGKSLKCRLGKNTIMTREYVQEILVDESVFEHKLENENMIIMYDDIKLFDTINADEYVDIKLKVNDVDIQDVLNNKKVLKIADNQIWLELSNVEQEVLLRAVEKIGLGNVVYAEKRANGE